MGEARRQRWILVLIGCLLIALNGVGLYQQEQDRLQGFAAVALAQAVLYLIAVWLVRRGGFGRHALVAILSVAALLRLSILFSPPYLSDDIYRYVWDGRVQAAGINPYRYIPVDEHLAHLRDDAIFPYINRKTYAPTIYPPAAQLIFLGATRLGESPIQMKIVLMAFEAIGIFFLIKSLSLAAIPTDRILIYAWHPLPVWEFAGSGHIDAALVTFIALALWARQRNRAWTTGVALAVGALIKFFPIVLLPALYRRWDWKMPTAFAATMVLGYLPFLGVGRAVFGFLPGYIKEEGNSTGFYLWSLARSVPQLHDLDTFWYLLFAAGIMAALGVLAFLRRGEDGFLAKATLLAIVFDVLLSPRNPWYFAWVVPLLCFVPYGPMIYLSAASFLLYVTAPTEPLMYGPFALLALNDWWTRRQNAMGDRRKEWW